ncbi:transmembrane protein, putative (macronuclear) [Tetrahymena thermophila SB210]|uniref:Transmembrane protein, putative n=1 Tax=Tetrahymena thermophila (strain SB210) TaxID=312017 RepID=W7X9Z6_TETTS|nr:transmembrane protein, putative [Tetrahymena thermophila SB210]EWS74152.1 transmembrane protein, putative [Tetrahymena thermophila SB210]|eukprot:XP_012653312.1 transmembrane protein, putative [Tetrahymena thermophila SB210]
MDSVLKVDNVAIVKLANAYQVALQIPAKILCYHLNINAKILTAYVKVQNLLIVIFAQLVIVQSIICVKVPLNYQSQFKINHALYMNQNQIHAYLITQMFQIKQEI